MKFKYINKKAQEEMLGFALIIILVAVIMLVFLGISVRSPQKEGVESYEVESFIQAVLQYHTDCAKTYETNFLEVQDLIFSCSNQEQCLDERQSCDVLNSTLRNIIDENWQAGPDRPVKGYEVNITRNEESLLSFTGGNLTQSYKGSSQDFVKSGSRFDIIFNAYYE